MQDGIVLMCIFKLFAEDEKHQPETKLMFLHPINRQEVIHNL